VYAQITNLVVYTETGDINVTEIAKDIVAMETDLSASVTEIGSNTYSLVPFVMDGESYADALTRACSFGDGAGAAWAASIVESAKGADGLPVLRIAAQPVLTGYDYAIRLDEGNVEPGVEFVQSIDGVVNWVGVKYRSIDGKTVYVNPLDDASLTDTASVTAWGLRHVQGGYIDVDTTSQAAAIAYGVRYLNQHKDPQWMASSGIAVKGWIRTSGGGVIPACRIRAGMLLRVENYLSDLAGAGTGLTLLISGTSYDAASEVNTLTVGVPDSMAVQIARMQAE
jgi:hypothetical protein